MRQTIEGLKQLLLSTDYPGWRRLTSCVFLLVLSGVSVITFGYLYFTTPELSCWTGFFYLSVVWGLIQTSVIAFLYFDFPIPVFARWSITMVLLVANIWFILFVFSLTPCG